LLFVGRLAGVKGLPVLMEAVAQLKARQPDVTLTVAGDGPDRERLSSLAANLGITQSVHFLGYQSQQQVRDLLARTDVFVMASFAEGVPVVLMEAMAAGVPVVATQIAGIPELVEHGVCGFLVPPADAGALAERVGQLLADAGLRNAYGSRGREKVAQEFDIEREAERLGLVLTAALCGETVPVRPPVQAEGDMDTQNGAGGPIRPALKSREQTVVPEVT
jgi:glycosyltransferase involved in cell wall biosynthesis